jgi:type I restriction enzyme R subunit
VPKTLIFAKNDAHAEDIVRTARQVFGRGDDFAQKITYTAKNAKDLLQKFRNSPELRIAVTVDMIATGTDVKPIECVFFMRDIKSGTYFEQMKGRGARTIDDATFQQVTPDATHKERFVIVDAIGVTEHDFVDVTTLDRNKSISLDKLLQKAANRELTQDDAATLASRLARLNRRLTPTESKEIQDISGTSLDVITSSLLSVTNPDEIAKVIETVQAQGSDEENLALHDFIQNAATPLAANPALRDRILGFHQNHYLYRDEITPDILLDAHGVVDLGRAKEIVESWPQYLEDNKDEVTAIHMLYSTPRGAKVTYQEIEDLIRTIRTPHPEWTPAVIWKAYQELQKTTKSLTNSTADLVSLIRYSLGVTDELRPFSEEVEDRFRNWLAIQEQAGVAFTEKQLWWLHNIKDAIATGITFSIDQLDMSPFNEEGGSAGIVTVFPNAKDIIDQINQELGA